MDCYFNFSSGDRVVWLAPNTSSKYAEFKKFDCKADGSLWVVINLLPGISGEKFNNTSIVVPADQVCPAFD